MSRHRFVRNARDDYDDDGTDDDLSSSYGNSVGNSLGRSPGMAAYIFDRQKSLSESTGGVKLDDEALVKDMIPQVYAVVNPAFTRDEVVEALRDAEYSVQDAIRHLLEQEAYKDFGTAAADTSAGPVDVFAMEPDDPPAQQPTRTVTPPPGFEPKVAAPLSEMGRLMANAPPKRGAATLPGSAPVLQSEFAFDTPSPDDAALAQRQQPKAKPVAAPATASPARPPIPAAVPATTTPPKDKSSSTLKKSASGVKNEPAAPNPLKMSQSGSAARITNTQIRPEKRTLQLLADIAAESAKAKERLNMVVIGHVDAGKSTLMGHLLHLLGTVDDRQMRKLKTNSEREGKGSFAFAWVMDGSDEERKRGVTIDVGQGHFETESKSITLLDAPGHLDFVPNMIVGAAQAEAALLVIDSTPNNFETGFSSSGQTKEHALLARSLGVSQLIVVINKLDAVGWSKERYEVVREQVSTFLVKQVGFRANMLQFVPCSGHKGINVVDCKEPALRSWYQGPTLMQCIDAFVPPAARDLGKPLRFYVTEVLGRGEAGLAGMGLAGKVESGFVAVGDQLLLMPLRQLVTVKTLKLQKGTSVPFARDGESLEMGVVGQDDSVFGVGDILCDPQHPIPVVRKFRAQLVVFQPPRPILKGDAMILHMHSVSAQCAVVRLRSIIDKKTMEVTQRKPRMLPHRCTAIVDIRLDRPMCMELFKEFAQFGRFMLRTNSKTAAAGIVTSLITLAKEEENGDEDEAGGGEK